MSAEAYSHEVVSFGARAGEDRIPALAPRGGLLARSHRVSLALLMWDDVRTVPDPEAAMTGFLESGYRAGASAAGWDPDLEAR